MTWSGYSEAGPGSEEVGPNTFSVSPVPLTKAQAQEQARPINAAVRIGIDGGQHLKYDDGSMVGAKAVEGLMKIASDKLAPIAKKLEEKAYTAGMTRAASGEALAQIVAEQPWYTKIFGDTPLVEGARAYTASAEASRWAARTEENMHELRKRNPQSMTDYLDESFANINTGDPDADALTKAMIVKQAPKLIERQTKEHVKYLQERASAARMDAWQAGAKRLQAAHLDTTGTYRPEDKQQLAMDFMADLAPTPGGNLQAWEKDLTNMLAWAATSGNFHAIRAAEASGMFAHLKPEDRIKLDENIKRAESQYAKTDGLEANLEDHLKVQHDLRMGRITPAQALQWFRDQNQEYKDRTGSSVELYPLAAVERGVTTAQQAVEQVARERLRALAQEQNAAVADAKVRELMVHNSPAYIAKLGYGKEGENERIAKEEFDKLDLPGKVNRMVAWGTQGQRAPELLRADLARIIASADYGKGMSDQLAGALQLYDTLKRQPNGGADAVGEWFQPEHINMMENLLAYGALSGDTKHRELALEMAQRHRELAKQPGITDKDSKAIRSFVDDQLSQGGFFGWFETKPNSASQAMVEQVMSQEYAKLGTLSGDARLKTAYRMAQRRFDTLGSHAYLVTDRVATHEPLSGIIEKKLGGKVSLDYKTIGDFANDLIERKIKEAGASTSLLGNPDKQVILKRDHDHNGKAFFSLISFDENSDPVMAVFDSDELADAIDQGVKKRQRAIPVPETAQTKLAETPWGPVPIK